MTQSQNINLPDVSAALKEWRQFMASLATQRRIGVVHHGDLDGVVGAAFMGRALAAAGHAVHPYWVSTDEYHFEFLRGWVAAEHVDACAVSDIALENAPFQLAAISAALAGPMFIFDHHRITASDPLPSNVRLANPTPDLVEGERHVPTFVFARELALNLGAAFPDWLLALAIFAEGVDASYGDVLNAIGPQIAPSVAGPYDRGYFRRSGLQRVSTLVKAEFSSSPKANRVLSLLDGVSDGSVRTFAEFRNALEHDLGAVADRLGRTASRIIEQWETKIPAQPQRLIVVPIQEALSVAGTVASVLRSKFPERIVMAYQSAEPFVSVEIRVRNDTALDLPKLLMQVRRTVPLVNSGGHPSAAGALLRHEFLDEFVRAFETAVASSSVQEH